MSPPGLHGPKKALEMIGLKYDRNLLSSSESDNSRSTKKSQKGRRIYIKSNKIVYIQYLFCSSFVPTTFPFGSIAK